MANLPVRQNGGGAIARKEWDPVSWARDLLRWDPVREIAPVFNVEPLAFAPAFDVKETKDGYLFRADVPGVLEKDIEVTRTGNRLTISGKREAEKEDRGDTFYTIERSYGSFTRSFTLPEGIDGDHVRAELKDGVLTLVLPKKPELQPKKINVSVASKEPQRS